MRRRWIGRTSRTAGAALRFCVALWLVVQIVYTPIHLSVEPHSEEADFSGSAPMRSAAAVAGDEGHEGDGHHERHPAAQHKVKVLMSERAAMVEVFLAPAVASVEVGQGCPQPQVVDFAGLSPPELPRCWQFFFRTALPVRAPSLLS